MKKNLTTATIVSLYNGLNGILDIPELKIGFHDKFHLIRNRNILEPFFKDFEGVRNELILKYGEMIDEQSGEYSIINEEKYKEFIADITPILNEEVSVKLHEIDVKSINDDRVEIPTIEALFPILIDSTDDESDDEIDNSIPKVNGEVIPQ